MKREIKFRAWDSISKSLWGWSVIGHIPLPDFDLEHYTLMQYTCLKDKNGKEIYEGDVLCYTVFDCYDNDSQFKGVVNWFGSGFIITQIPDSLNNGEFGLELYWVHNQDCEIEVIGNIYENPELIK